MAERRSTPNKPESDPDESFWVDLNVKTKSVEASLAPLIKQVTTLARHDPSVKRGQGYSAYRLAQAVDKAVEQFILIGEEIARENSEMEETLLESCESVFAAGRAMHTKSREFVAQSWSSERRSDMIVAARALLTAITKLLVAADVADMRQLLKTSHRIEDHLRKLQKAENMTELMQSWKAFAPEIITLMNLAAQRQEDVKDEGTQEQLAASRALFDKASKLFLTTAEAHLDHKEINSALENKTFILGQMGMALKTIALVAEGRELGETASEEVIEIPAAMEGELERTFHHLLHLVEEANKRDLTAEEKGEMEGRISVISRAAEFLSQSEYTRDYRQDKIISCCKAVKESFKHLVDTVNSKEAWRERRMEEILLSMGSNTVELRRELRHAMLDHVSDIFVDTSHPVQELLQAAEGGQIGDFEDKMTKFLHHARDLEKVATLACSLSSDGQGVKLTKYITKRVMILAPQVVNAADTLVGNTKSKSAQRNMAAFEGFWKETVHALVESIDTIIPVQDFLAVSDVHIREEVDKCLRAAAKGAFNSIHLHASFTRGRCTRMMRVIQSDIEENPARFTKDHETKILTAAVGLREKALPRFSDEAERAVNILKATHDSRLVEMSTLHKTSQTVLDCVNSLRIRYLQALTKSELEEDPESLGLVHPTLPSNPSLSSKDAPLLPPPPPNHPPTDNIVTSPTGLLGAGTGTFQRSKRPSDSNLLKDKVVAKSIMADLPETEQIQLSEASLSLKEKHAELETQASQWGEDGGENDLVALAKEMCIMMLDMSDFTQGAGPLQTTADVIVTAKDIARAGGQLNVIAQEIANECPDQSCKRDILAYLDQVQLCSHQLKITSAVKADLNASVRETVESASALITAAKNLMTSVVLLVKLCYIASRAIAKVKGSLPSAWRRWEMNTPRKKDLVSMGSSMGSRSPKQGERATFNRNNSTLNPLKELCEFRGTGTTTIQSTCV